MIVTELTILVEGYARPGDNGLYIASPTTSLITTKSQRILVDPGTNSKLLFEALERNKLTLSDITKVFLTHYHPDHFLNLRLFGNVDLFDGTTKWHEDTEESYADFIPGTDVAIIPTPGHTLEHCSLLMDEVKLGKVCIAQDVFWWEDGKQDFSTVEALMNLEDPFAVDVTLLMASRKKVLELADWIVPGHGKMFKNPVPK